MADPGLIPSDSASQNSVTFVIIAVQQALADYQPVALAPSCELFWNPNCTNLTKPKSILDGSVSRTMPDVPFIDGHPSVIHNHSMDSFSAFLYSGHGGVS
jgi:hypothetical protein